MPHLLDATKLAKELGVSTWVTYASKRAGQHYGDTPWMGRYTTKERFLGWLERHPDFSASRWMRGAVCDTVVTVFQFSEWRCGAESNRRKQMV